MLDDGIGLSAMLDGRMLHGDGPIFGELGHVVVDRAGAICRCGNRGCLETIAGVDAIVARVDEHVNAGMGPPLARPITIKRVIDSARDGRS
jgi:predicted NBD/HSP70 family sugar kinase